MNKPSRDMALLQAETLLPAGALLGDSRIEISGSRQVLLTGHRGIRKYEATEIVVELRDCAVSIRGAELGIRSMTRQEVMLGGALESLCFLR